MFFVIYSFWSINTVDVDEENKVLTRDLTTKNRQKDFSILKPTKKDESLTLHG